MAKNILAILYFLVAALTAVRVSGAKCPTPEPVPRHFLDLERYLGRWYVIAAGSNYDTSFLAADCVDSTYSHNPSNPHLLNVDYSARVNGSYVNEVGLASVTFLTVPSEWTIFLAGSYFPTYVVATDHDSFSVHYSCKDDNGQGDAQYTFTVLSRNRTLDATLMADISAYVEGLGMSTDELFGVNQNSC